MKIVFFSSRMISSVFPITHHTLSIVNEMKKTIPNVIERSQFMSTLKKERENSTYIYLKNKPLCTHNHAVIITEGGITLPSYYFQGANYEFNSYLNYSIEKKKRRVLRWLRRVIFMKE